LGTPALRAIRRRFPRARIWILTIPEVKPLADRCPYVDAVRALDLRASRSALVWGLGRRRRELRQLIRELRSMRFDVAVNLYQVGTRAGGLRMAVFLRMIGAGMVVGRGRGGWGQGLDLASDRGGHEIEAQLAVARLIGAPSEGDLPELWVTEGDTQACASLLETFGVSGAERLACLHAGSAQPEKRWPADRFAVVGKYLAQAGARVALIGTQSERALCAPLLQAIPGAISLAGETSLPVLAALLRRAALLVTNDSGPMHMAAALGTPIVVPFGPGTPAQFGPRGRGACMVFTGGERPEGSPWWEGIPADAIAGASLRLLADSPARAGARGGSP
jgi:ADP-heptose:LPS heptosyltransferase